MRRFVLLLLALGGTGCIHHRSEDQILAAFVSEGPQILKFDTLPMPQYIRFRDDQSACVFSPLTRAGYVRVAPEGSGMLCPGTDAEGIHGYLVGAHADTVVGDSTVATVTLFCNRVSQKCPDSQPCISMGGNSVEYSTSYLLRRRNGKWKVEKPLFGSIMLPM